MSGIAFYGGGSYPASYDGALVFADHSRNCIWTMGLGAGGLPDPTRLQVLATGAANPVDVETGPGGDLYYVDFDGGTIHHISYSPVPPCDPGTFRAEYYNNVTLAGQPVLTRCEPAIDHDWGVGSPAPEVNPDSFSASWSRDVDLAPGTYTFTARADDGIRVYVDGTAVIDAWFEQPPTTYTATVPISNATHHVRVEYYEDGNTAVAQVSWHLDVPDGAPTAAIDTPGAALTYVVGQAISFSGHADDPEQGALPATALTWTLLVHHCTTPAQCHVHTVQSWTGTAGGTLNAPDHEYPSHLELVLRATDALGVTSAASVTLDPRTVALTFRTVPAGLTLTIGSASGIAPFARTEIVGSQTSVSAPATQLLGGKTFHLASWSDGRRGDAQHHRACELDHVHRDVRRRASAASDLEGLTFDQRCRAARPNAGGDHRGLERRAGELRLRLAPLRRRQRLRGNRRCNGHHVHADGVRRRLPRRRARHGDEPGWVGGGPVEPDRSRREVRYAARSGRSGGTDEPARGWTGTIGAGTAESWTLVPSPAPRARAGTRAVGACEPRQIREEAALSNPSQAHGAPGPRPRRLCADS